jgi:hypothetical protein
MNATLKPDPHHRLTLRDVVRDYKDGLLTVKGAIFYGISATTKPGNKMHLTPKLVAEQLGVHLVTVYRKISQLATERRINFEATGNLITSIPIRDGKPEYLFFDELLHSDHVDLHSDHVDLHSDHVDLHSDHVDLQKCKNEPLEPLPHGDSVRSSTNTTNASNASLSMGERVENDPDFLEWLNGKADSLPKKPTLLKQWLRKQASNQENQAEFLQHRKSLEQIKFSAAPAPANLPPELRKALAEGDSTLAYEIACSRGISVGEIRFLLEGVDGAT